jgi:Rrf2 family protein
MKFSNSIEYAIHGLIFLSTVPAGTATQITDVAKAIKVPEAYLRKVFQELTRRGILSSQRGVRGGFYLSGDPENISLKDVVEAIDGSLPMYGCLRDRRSCSITLECPVKEAFEEARQKMAEVLDATSIKGLREDLKKHRQEAAWLAVGA